MHAVVAAEGTFPNRLVAMVAPHFKRGLGMAETLKSVRFWRDSAKATEATTAQRPMLQLLHAHHILGFVAASVRQPCGES